MSTQAGKGSKPRPTNIKRYQAEYDRIFRLPPALSPKKPTQDKAKVGN